MNRNRLRFGLRGMMAAVAVAALASAGLRAQERRAFYLENAAYYAEWERGNLEHANSNERSVIPDVRDTVAVLDTPEDPVILTKERTLAFAKLSLGHVEEYIHQAARFRDRAARYGELRSEYAGRAWWAYYPDDPELDLEKPEVPPAR